MVVVSTKDARFDFRAVRIHKHLGNIDVKWGRITRLDRQDDYWHPLVEVFANAPYAGKLAEASGPSGDDDDAIGRETGKLGVEHCQHPSGKAVVFRFTGTPTKWRDSSAKGEDWRAIYGFEHAATVATMFVPASEASTCEVAAARFPEPLSWLAEEMKAKQDKDSHDNEHRVVVKDLEGVPSTKGFDASLFSNLACGSPVGFIVATQEGILLKEAFDWALEYNQHGRVAFFRKALEKGDAEGLSRHFLSRLEPVETTPDHASVQDDQLDEIVPLLHDEQAQRETLDKIVSQCALPAYGLQCHGWRLRIAAKIAARLGDQPRCDLLLALLPDLGPRDEGYNPYDVTRRALFLLRAARLCASPVAVRKAAVAALGITPIDPRGYEPCTIDPTTPAPTEQCEILPLYAASILVAECHPDGIQGARATLKSSSKNIEQFAAACVLGRCEGPEAFRRAIAETGIPAPQYLIDVCGLDLGAPPAGSVSAR